MHLADKRQSAVLLADVAFAAGCLRQVDSPLWKLWLVAIHDIRDMCMLHYHCGIDDAHALCRKYACISFITKVVARFIKLWEILPCDAGPCLHLSHWVNMGSWPHVHRWFARRHTPQLFVDVIELTIVFQASQHTCLSFCRFRCAWATRLALIELEPELYLFHLQCRSHGCTVACLVAVLQRIMRRRVWQPEVEVLRLFSPSSLLRHVLRDLANESRNLQHST